MALTTIRGGIGTFPTSTSGGSIPDANIINDITEWAMEVEPTKTPFLTEVGIGSAVEQKPHHWGQKGLPPITSVANGSHNNSTTTLNVAVGSGVIFQRYMVLEWIEFQSGTTIPDPTAREIVYISAEPVADALTIIRAQGGTSAIAHADGSQVNIIGVAEPEMQFHTLGPVTRGFQLFNYVQRFEGGVKADLSARNTPTYEDPTDVMLSDYNRETAKQKKLLEIALFKGGRQAGDPSTPIGAMMGGLPTFVTSNFIDLGNAKLTSNQLEGTLADLTQNTEDGPGLIRLVMSINTSRIWDRMLNPIRMAGSNDTSVSLFVETIKYRFGTFEIAPSQWCPNSDIYGLRMKNLSVRPYRGSSWHMTERPGKVHGADHDEMYISGDFTFEVLQEKSMFRITNFNQDITAYGDLFN